MSVVVDRNDAEARKKTAASKTSLIIESSTDFDKKPRQDFLFLTTSLNNIFSNFFMM